jgi:hypothetical protein
MREENCLQCGKEYAIYPRQPDGMFNHPFCSAGCRDTASDYGALLEEAKKVALHLREKTSSGYGIHPFALVIGSDGRAQRLPTGPEEPCTFAEAADRVRAAALSCVARGAARAAAVILEVHVRKPDGSNAFQIEMAKPGANPVTMIFPYRDSRSPAAGASGFSGDQALHVLGEPIVISGECPLFFEEKKERQSPRPG